MKKIFLILFLVSSFAGFAQTDAANQQAIDSLKTNTAKKNNATFLWRLYTGLNNSKFNITNGDILPKANGGTGTSTPALIAGTNISITGSWPNQTINSLGGISSFTTSGTLGASTFSGGTLNIPQYQGQITLTTSGSSGAATFSGGTLNIPNYSGGATLIDNIVNIGSWDMSSMSTKLVTHGLTFSKIRSITAVIVNDPADTGITSPKINGSTIDFIVDSWGTTQVLLKCTTADFDSDWSLASNRGYLIIRTTP